MHVPYLFSIANLWEATMKKLCLTVTAVFALVAINSGPVRAQTADVSANSDQELATLRKQIRQLEQNKILAAGHNEASADLLPDRVPTPSRRRQRSSVR
jgi:hypothetical protein